MITLCYVFHVHYPLFLLVINASTHIADEQGKTDKASEDWSEAALAREEF